MRWTRPLSPFALVAVAAPVWAGDPTPTDDPMAKLIPAVRGVVEAHFPEASVEVRDDGVMIARHDTMTFTVHPIMRDGKILPRTEQIEGPTHLGFLLTISVADGQYNGPAVVPQILRYPYWQTFIDRPPTPDGDGHYGINFSFGSRLNRDFVSDLHAVLPDTPPPSPPTPSATDTD